jgi:hypothetical protein
MRLHRYRAIELLSRKAPTSLLGRSVPFVLCFLCAFASIVFINMPKDTSTGPTKVHCGCYRCQHNGSETVSLRTYRRHKQYHTEGSLLSSEFQQFIASKTTVPPTSTASSPPRASTSSEGESFPHLPGENGILMDLDTDRDIVRTSSSPTRT